jgi:hypothetical protein
MGLERPRPERTAIERLEERAREWGVSIDQSIETEGSLIAFGCRDRQRVVLKVVKHRGDEWRSGEVLSAFAGRGVARVYEYVGGSLLLERLDPGDSLAQLALGGRDDEATAILADVVRAMGEPRNVSSSATAEEWGIASSTPTFSSTGSAAGSRWIPRASSPRSSTRSAQPSATRASSPTCSPTRRPSTAGFAS